MLESLDSSVAMVVVVDFSISRRIVMLVYQADTLFQQMSIRNYR